MKEISKGAFLRSVKSPLGTVQSVQEVQFGNSLFGDFTTMVQVNNVYFVRESRVYYKTFTNELEESFFMFDNAAEADKYFSEAEAFADEYSAQNGTCAGGF